MNKWRLPTIQELKSIVDYTKYNPATNLEGIKSARYWSSSPLVSISSDAWSVSFNYGYDYNSNKSISDYVRCVRTLEDGSLEWAKEDAPRTMNWQEAIEYAESLNVKQKAIFKSCELWQPKEGEVCIFEQYNLEYPIIARCTEKLKAESLSWEPFIGQLPSFLKDKE